MNSGWKEIDKYHMRFGFSEWRISKAFNVPFPYSLYHYETSHGHFVTLDEAKTVHLELLKNAVQY